MAHFDCTGYHYWQSRALAEESAVFHLEEPVSPEGIQKSLIRHLCRSGKREAKVIANMENGADLEAWKRLFMKIAEGWEAAKCQVKITQDGNSLILTVTQSPTTSLSV
jgi:hypothetical protein